MIALKNTTDKQIFYILKKSGGSINPHFDLTQLDVEFTENGQYSILPPAGYDGLSQVNVTVDVAGSCNLTTSTATITESGEHTITPPTGYDGFTEVTVNVDTSTAYNEGKQDGIDEQKSKLASVTFTENGTYNREDGWDTVTVNVDSTLPDLSVIGWTRQMILDAGIQDSIDDTATGTENYPVFASITPSSQSGNARLCYVPEWDTSGLTDMSDWFNGCTALMKIPQIDTSNVENTSNMFRGCTLMNQRLTLDLSSCIYAISMFEDCYNLPMPVLQNTGNILDMGKMFSNCGRYLTPEEDSISLDTSSCTNMAGMFAYCQGLKTVGELDCSDVYNVNGMFFACDALQNVGGFKNLGQSFTGSITNFHKLDLSDCPSLSTTSTHNILDKLGTVSVTASVIFDPDVFDALDPDDIASATAKGWSIIS